MATTQSDVQSVLDRYVVAVKNSDVDGMMALYADNVHVFDLMAPFERHGKDRVREMIAPWLSNQGEQQACSIVDAHIEQDGDLAMAHASIRYEVTMPDGTHHSMWNRGTWGLRRIDGEWKIVLEHTSVPLSEDDMQPVFDGKS